MSRLLFTDNINADNAAELKTAAIDNNCAIIATLRIAELDSIGGGGIDANVFSVADRVVTLYHKECSVSSWFDTTKMSEKERLSQEMFEYNLAELHVIKNRGRWLDVCWLQYSDKAQRYIDFDYLGYYVVYEVIMEEAGATNDDVLAILNFPQSLLDSYHRRFSQKQPVITAE